MKFVSFFVIIASLAILNVSSSSRENCQELGFNPSVLLCSTCSTVQKFVSDSSVTEKCNECCISNPTDSEEKYKLAVLEVDSRFIGFYPELDAIIKMKNKLKLTVRYRFGAPTLMMFKNKKDTEPIEQLNVASWNQETIKDYLKSHLET
mmetsp:Transcript_11551/g.15868  ORF Transcript_11551/g.15868 Transcript_11551/m.15868 type:complete len:149 (+) Transcript_11551:26-472(+)